MLSAVFMFWFWHQSSFIGHDSLHNVVFRSQKSAHLFALLFSNYGNGISAAWWKYTHNQHHMVPNEFERDPDIMHLPVFAMTHRGTCGAPTTRKKEKFFLINTSILQWQSSRRSGLAGLKR